MNPIHKYNSGNGATLCNKCRVIISEGFTDDLFCDKCQPKWSEHPIHDEIEKQDKG